jgi:hypothetical protein
MEDRISRLENKINFKEKKKQKNFETKDSRATKGVHKNSVNPLKH